MGAGAVQGETSTAIGDAAQTQQEQTFTQADVEKIVRDRLTQQAKNKFGDYEEIKARAEGAKTVEQKLADLEARYKDAETKALRSDIAAKFGLSAEDRDLFLTGADEDTLTAQAQRLADRVAAVKKQGNVAPKEGNTTSQADEKAPLREFAKQLFDRAE
jgi:hypothetical protein